MALDAYFSLFNGRKEFWQHCWGYTFSLLFYLRNTTGLIFDLEGYTEVTSTSDLPSSEGPSCVMVRAAARQPWAALRVPPSRTVILEQIFPLAHTSALAADILTQASPFSCSCQRSPAV